MPDKTCYNILRDKMNQSRNESEIYEFTESDKEKAYKHCLDFAKNHYENFPVVSFLIPEKLRKHVAVIYWFARTADDMADEGENTSEERLEKLGRFEERFTALLNKKFASPFEFALYSTITEKNLQPELFIDLLKAFKQDVVKKRYKNFDEVLAYCKNSADPVGRLILLLFGITDSEAMKYSDNICTALQLTNFLQDTGIDLRKGRIYLPGDEMEKFGVIENMFELKENNLNLKKLLEFNINRTQRLFDEGKKLYPFLKGLLKLEIKWTVLSGESILSKLKNNNFDVFNNRPELSKKDFIFLLLKAIIK